MRRVCPWIAAVAVLLGALVTLGPAAAQDEPAAIPEERIRGLIDTLEDPERRARLIADLEALLAASEEPAPDPEDAVSRVLDEISARTAVVRQVARTLADRLDEVPELIAWLEAQLSQPATRQMWLWVGMRVLLVLGIGTAAHVLVAFAFRRQRAELRAAAPLTVWQRLPRALGALVLDLLPVVAFALAAYAALLVLDLRTVAQLVALHLIHAVLIVRTGVAVLRMLFAPKAPGLRLLPLDHGAAEYGMRWSRHILGTSVYGYFILEAARELGLPWALHGLLLHVLFLVVAFMAMVVIVQSRAAIAAALASLGDESRSPALRRLPWQTLAGVWHILALIYVLFIYLVWALRIPGGFQILLQATLGSAVVAILGWLLWRAVDQVFGREMQPSEDAPTLRTGIEGRIARYLPILGGLARALVVLGVILGLLEVWGFGTLSWLFSDAGNAFVGHVLTVLVIILITIAAWELISLMIERSVTEKDEAGNLRLSNRTRTLLNITRNVLLVFLSVIALFLVLAELGLNVAPLLAGAGVIGIAIGFGSQKLVQDIITGMFILLSDTVRVGDVVEIAGRSGVVEEVSMRTVALRDLSGNVHTIPYSAIDTVTNLTKDFAYAVLDIGVAYRENVDEVIQVLHELGEGMNRDPTFRRNILEPLEVFGVERFADSAVIIRARFKTRPLKQWETAREFRRRIKNRFDELGIEIPYPHQTVYFGADKAGRASPARVEVQLRAGAAARPQEPAAQASDRETPAPVEPAIARTGGA